MEDGAGRVAGADSRKVLAGDSLTWITSAQDWERESSDDRCRE